MIFRSSSYKQAKTCWRKAFNLYHEKLGTPRGYPLIDGGAIHKGIAAGLATKDWGHAREVARESFLEETKDLAVLPELEFQRKSNLALCEAEINIFASHFKDETYTVVQPECKFEAPLPNSHHNCIWKHFKMRIWDSEHQEESEEHYYREPTAEEIQRGIITPHTSPNPNCPCWSPHKVRGTTDAIISWKGALWFVDHKTSSITGEQFWSQWHLDFQMTAYTWGIWKTMGIKPSGFIINMIKRPSDGQVANWNSKRKSGAPKGVIDYLGFEREMFLRTNEDLVRFEEEAKQFCEEWEWRMVGNRFGMSPIAMACNQYNRVCDFKQMCVTHGRDREGLVQLESVEV